MTVEHDDVEELLGSTEIADLDPFIGPAGRLYDPLIEGESITKEKRDDVVAALAAHLVASMPERQVHTASEGSGSVTFEGETGEGLAGTTYGQMAVTLDPTGSLATSDLPSPSVSVPDAKGIRD